MDTFFHRVSQDLENAAADPGVRRRSRRINRATAACLAGAAAQIPLALHAGRQISLTAGALTVLTAVAVAASAAGAAYAARTRFSLTQWAVAATVAGSAIGYWWSLCPWDRALPVRWLVPLLLALVVVAMVDAVERRR